MKKKLMALTLAVVMLLAMTPAALAAPMANIAYTTLYGSSANKLSNLQLAIDQLDGTAVYYGEAFSFNETIGPRTRDEGYKGAMNGRGSNVTAGGVSQLATTLYLAASESPFVAIEPFEAYGDKFVDWYVEDGADAVITDYKAGKDFSFISYYPGIMYISAWMSDDAVYCMLTYDGREYTGNQVARSSTPIYGSANKQYNIALAADAVNGVCLEFGDTFSFNYQVGPRTADAGFLAAENGRGVKVYGGGVAQVASTIYLAIKDLADVSIDPIRTYGRDFVDGYVSDPADAVVTDYNAGTDFSFTYWGDKMLTVMVYEDNGRLVCEIYEE